MPLVTAPPGLYVPLDGSGDLPSVEVVEELSKLFTRFVEDPRAVKRAPKRGRDSDRHRGATSDSSIGSSPRSSAFRQSMTSTTLTLEIVNNAREELLIGH